MSATPSKATRKRAQLSCDRCRLIKRKCDRVHPCSRCTEDQEECNFERAKRTRKGVSSRGEGAAEKACPALTSPRYLHWGKAQQSRTHAVPRLFPGTQGNVSPLNALSLPPSPLATNTPSSDLSSKSSLPSASSREHQSGNASNVSRLHKLVEHPVFLRHVVAIFCEEVEPFFGLMCGSRLQRMAEAKLSPQSCPQIWEDVHLFAFASTAIVAQQSPASMEAALINLSAEARQGYSRAQEVAESAYNAALDGVTAYLKCHSLQSLPAELFAGTLILRKYEKNAGLIMLHVENMSVDVARMQRSGYHQHFFHMKAGSDDDGSMLNTQQPPWPPSIRPDITWNKEHDTLAYNVFCHYFSSDRIISLFSGSGYTMQGRHINVCLNDVFGHISFAELCNEVDGNRASTCGSCGAARHPSAVVGPMLNAYEGASLRITALMGRYFDRLSSALSATFRWPADAEDMALQLDADLSTIETMISQLLAKQPKALDVARHAMISLEIAHVKRQVANLLCDAFAARSARQRRDRGSTSAATTLSDINSKTIEWLLQRRKLDAAKALILHAINGPRQLSVSRPNSIFLPKFVGMQAQDLLDCATHWARCWDECYQSMKQTAYVDAFSQSVLDNTQVNLVECLRYVLMARNFLVVFARRSELSYVHTIVRGVCERCTAIFERLLQGLMDVQHIAVSTEVVNGDELINAVERHLLHTIQSTSLSRGTVSSSHDTDTLFTDLASSVGGTTNLDESLASLFADLPALEQLFLRSFDDGADWGFAGQETMV